MDLSGSVRYLGPRLKPTPSSPVVAPVVAPVVPLAPLRRAARSGEVALGGFWRVGWRFGGVGAQLGWGGVGVGVGVGAGLLSAHVFLKGSYERRGTQQSNA